MEAKKKSWFLGNKVLTLVSAFMVLLTAGCGGSSGNTVKNEAVVTESEQQVVFDVPTLLEKNIDEVEEILGKPTIFIEPKSLNVNNGSWEKTFEKNGYELMVTYDLENKNVIDFFLGTNDPSNQTSDLSELKKISNVKNGAQNYIVEDVKTIKDPSMFTGIIITPKK